MIEMSGITKAFASTQVLAGVDLAVATGESLVVIGQSGTGKSVLLKTVLGLVPPDRGEVRLDGEVLDRKRRVLLARSGMLFQGAALFDSLTIWQNVAFRLTHTRPRLSKADARAVAIEKLARVGLGPEVADRYPSELSGGMQKRAGLARAIAHDPDILFFDEPTTGLDPINATRISRLIREVVDAAGATAITITHDMASVRIMADRVAMLDQGRIRWQGPVTALDDPGDALVAEFVAG